ncbi:MAG TPA: hypothetical protein PKW82_04740 [Spirochaetales bacterium]|nr:hypothetical protein [Spirochaetales bacterium]
MKRIVALACLALFALTLAAESYKAPVVVKEMGFGAKLEGGKVIFAWKQYLRDDLKYYKLVKSKTNPNPVYPEDGYIFVGDREARGWVEEKPEPGVWYYRLCIITNGGERWVSPVIKLEIKAASGGVPTSKDFGD